MNNTRKTLSALVTPLYKNMSLEQLAAAYEVEGLNPSILATAFIKTFDLINYISQGFFGLSSQDISGFSLEVLDACLRSYNPESAKFSSYFSVVFRNRLRTETEALSTHKRKVALLSVSLDAMTSNKRNKSISSGLGSVTDNNDFVDFESPDFDRFIEDEIFMDALKNLDLTDREFKYCCLLIDGYTNKEIAPLLNVSLMTLCNMRKSLRPKLSPLFIT